jgi:VanZ family protein
VNPHFSILSAFYIFTIFFWADSSAVSQISAFNPFSLLHIPLYGILTILLILALCPGNQMASRSRPIWAALIAVIVGALDEYHQSFIPSRDASLSDVLLDAVGAALILLGAHWFPVPSWRKGFQKLKKKLT